MKSLTVALFVFAAFPAAACPFHGFFLGEDDAKPEPRSLERSLVVDKPGDSLEAKPRALLRFMDFNAQLKQWEEGKTDR